MTLLINACKDFYLDVGRFPSSLSELVVSGGSAKWDGPYLDPPKVPQDAWGHPFVYVAPTDERCWWGIISLGADGRPNGTKRDADIWYPRCPLVRERPRTPISVPPAVGG